MTKNRKHKHAVRTAAERTGAKYTKALRASDAVTGAPGPEKPPVPVWRFPLGTYAHEAPQREHGASEGDSGASGAVLDLGGDTGSPFTVIAGPPASGKTVLAIGLVEKFLATNPEGQVIWATDIGRSAGLSARRVFRIPQVTAVADTANLQTVVDERDPSLPTLVVVDDLDMCLNGLISVEDRTGRERAFLATLIGLGRTGRKDNIRTVLVGIGVSTYDPQLATSTGSRIWLGQIRSVHDWAHFFNVDDLPEAVTAVARGLHGPAWSFRPWSGWLQSAGGQPELTWIDDPSPMALGRRE